MAEPFNEIEQIEMAIKAAQKTVGQATISMNEDQLETALKAIDDAKRQVELALKHEISEEYAVHFSNELIRLEHQVTEAKK